MASYTVRLISDPVHALSVRSTAAAVIKLQISCWERQRAQRQSRSYVVLVSVYDVTRRETLENIEEVWMPEVAMYRYVSALTQQYLRSL